MPHGAVATVERPSSRRRQGALVLDPATGELLETYQECEQRQAAEIAALKARLSDQAACVE